MTFINRLFKFKKWLVTHLLTKNQFLIFVSLSSIIALLSYVVLFKEIKHTQFHGDESGWISSGYYYTNLLLRHDFEWQKWHKKELIAWGYMNPHLGKWLIGIPLKLHFADQEFSRLYDFSRFYEENEREGRIPPLEILLYARAVSAIVGGLCCLLIFITGSICYNLWVGMISAALLLVNKLFLLYATRAMTDISYSFFLVCLSLCAFLLIQKASKRAMVVISLLFGVISGLACSVKITGIVIGGLFFTKILLYTYYAHGKRKEIVLFLAIFCFSAMAIVYILNPLFWPDFKVIRGPLLIREFASFPEELKEIIMARKLPEETMLETYIEQYPQTINLARVLIFPYLFVKWNSYMNNQKNLPSASWYGNRLKTFHKTFLFHVHNSAISTTSVSFFLEGLFLCVGIILCSMKMYTTIRNGEVTLWSIPFLYFVTNYLFILIFMKLNWDRYYLPTIIASKIIVAVGMYEVSLYIFRSLFLSRKTPASTPQINGA